MKAGIHFISGLPRSGSTLLSAILRQNPRFHAGITGPAGHLVDAMLRAMSMDHESSIFLSDMQREQLLHGIFSSLYDSHPTGDVIFDTNRGWCAKLPLIADLFPAARIICCVRDVPWILDSIERLVRKNKFQPSGIFNFEPGGTVYSRVEGLASATGMVGYAWNALHEAFCGEQAGPLLAVTYETLTQRPEIALAAIYDFLGEAQFEHDFETILFEADEFDRRLGTPGLHAVASKINAVERGTVLPPALFQKFAGDMFWRDPARNPNNVRVI